MGRDNKPTDAYQPGMGCWPESTLFAEGCRGHLGKQLNRSIACAPAPTPGIWPRHQGAVEIVPERHAKGLVLHTAGWPLASDTYGGSFCYHYGENLVAIGYVVGR